MRNKKKKIVQLNLFTTPSAGFEDEVYIKFKAYAYNLWAEGFSSLCESWWRSRFHEMLYPGHHRPKTEHEWEYRHKAESNWMIFWNRFKTEFML